LKKAVLLIVASLMLVILAYHSYALTGSIIDPQATLRPNVTLGQTKIIDRSITVENLNDEALQIDLYVTEGSEKYLIIPEEEKSFILEPRARKKVEYTVRIDDPYTHVLQTNVKFTSVENGGPGIILPQKLFIIGTVENPVPENDTAEPNVETEQTTQNVANDNEQIDDNASSVSFGLKKPAQTEKIDLKTGRIKSNAPNPLIGIGILVIVVFIGAVIFLILSNRGEGSDGKEGRASKKGKAKSRVKAARKKTVRGGKRK